MVSDLFFSGLLLLGLLGLCVMLPRVWCYTRATPGLTTPKPAKALRKRSGDPTLFLGLIHKPLCAACEPACEPIPQPPGCPPLVIVHTRGCPRQIDPSAQFCPNPDCAYYGRVGFGNLHANGHPGGGPWRQWLCTVCNGYVLETHGTPLYGKRVTPDLLVWAVGALAEGLGIRAVARVFEVDPNTVLQWLVEAAEHLQAFSQYFLHDLRVTQVQLDELFALLSAVKDGEVSEAEALKRLSRSPHWVWVAIDPVTKLLLAIDVGARTLAMAQCVVHQVVQVLAPDCVPVFLTDGFKEYITALLTHFGHWVQPERRQAKGPAPKPSRTSNHEALITFHEMGHYITNRLIGNGNGLTNRQGRAMGEGWGDFFALCMTSQPADNFATGVFAVGGWTDVTATFTDNYYYSIRRYPYTANMNKNPLTFKHISSNVVLPANAPRNPNGGGPNNEVHNAGEVWCAALWEVFVNLVAKHAHAEAERRMLEYVIGGLKVTPSRPTYTDARDAIVTAVSALDAGDLPDVWSGFAKRGMGVDAVSPPSDSSTLAGVVESFDVP